MVVFKVDGNNLIDFHLHTKFSDDSILEIDDLVDAAIEKNIKILCITDHVEPEEFEENRLSKELKLKTESYFKEIAELRQKWESRSSSREVKILTGVELGLSPETLDIGKKYIKANSFDFVLGSLHAVNGREVNDRSLYELRDEKEVLRIYLEELYRCIKKFDEFDSLAHIDLIRRYIKRYKGKNEIFYCFNPDPELNYLVDDILRIIRDKGKGLEVNSSGYRYGLLTPMPSFEVIKRFRGLGGEIITIGSDAHSTNQVGEKLQNVREIILEAGFKYVFKYEKRKALPLKLK